MLFVGLSNLSLPFFGAVLGIVIAKLFPLVKHLGLKLILSFSGAFLLGIIVFELLPEIFSTGGKNIAPFVMGGILFQIVLEFFSKGAEHGHFHHKDTQHFQMALWISLCLHAVVEGIPLSESNSLSYGILIHKIPIGIILYLILDKTIITVFYKWTALFLFCIMTPLGMLLSGLIPSLNGYNLEITSWVVGMLLHISTIILFESTENHNFNLRKLSVILIAIVLSYFM